MLWIILAYAVAWLLVVNLAPELWVVALLGFVQNIAFTFVSRGRNSGSLGYHLVASIFSNGLYAALLFVSIDQVAQAKSTPLVFLGVYTLATMSGSIFAHWLAMRLEKGKGKSVQVNHLKVLEDKINETNHHANNNLMLLKIENENLRTRIMNLEKHAELNLLTEHDAEQIRRRAMRHAHQEIEQMRVSDAVGLTTASDKA